MKIAFLFFFILFSSLQAEERVSLKEALEKSSLNNLEDAIENYKIEQSQSDIKRANAEFSPKIEASFGAGPINKVTGDSMNSVEDKNKWGALYIGNIDFTWPIYTWGRKGDYEKAAKEAVGVKEIDKKLKTLEIRYNVKKTYYGFLYTNTLLDLVKGVKEELSKILDNKKLAGKERFRLEILFEQINAKEAEALKNREMALRGFRLYVSPSKKALLPKEDWLDLEERELRPLEEYLSLSKNEKGEFQKLEKGILAKESLSKAEAKGSWPVVAFIAKYDFAYTNMRNAQKSAFAYDPYNGTNAVIGIGVKWTYDWGVSNYKSEKVRAETNELMAQRLYANEGLAALLEKAWLEVKEAETNLNAQKKASKLGKQWLTKFMGKAALGGPLGDTKEMVEAYEARLLTLKDFYEAIFKYNMAWAELTNAVGTEVDPTLK